MATAIPGSFQAFRAALLALLCHVTHLGAGKLWRCIEDSGRTSRDSARREWRGVLPAMTAGAAGPVHWLLFFFPACKALAKRRCCR